MLNLVFGPGSCTCTCPGPCDQPTCRAETDRNILTCELNLAWKYKINENKRKDIFNFKSLEGEEKFHEQG